MHCEIAHVNAPLWSLLEQGCFQQESGPNILSIFIEYRSIIYKLNARWHQVSRLKASVFMFFAKNQ
jgi:hypothetical protein